jgi:hypothetical protein
MRMAEPTIQRACAPCTARGSTCPTCEDEKSELVQRKVARPSGPTDSVPNDFLRDLGPGQPLGPAERAFFEPRFGRDFGHIRIHAGGKAAESAGSVEALAYTSGRDIVFGEAQFAPGTDAGRRLLAHELTHVIQQGDGRSAGPKLQRACGPSGIGTTTPPDCELISQPLGERRYLFQRECDEFEVGEEARMLTDLTLLPPGTTVKVLGAASTDGIFNFNVALSCARARAAKLSILGAAGAPHITSVQAVGPQGPLNDQTFRAVSLEFTYPGPTSRVPPPPGQVILDPGGGRPTTHPVLGFVACQAIPPLPSAAPVCGTPFTGLPCPAWYCTPYPSLGIARACRDASTLALLTGITAIVADTRVTPYWALFLLGGVSGQLDLSTIFGTDFATHPVSVGAAAYLESRLQSYVGSAASTLFVGPGPWTIDFSSALATEIANLETTGHPQLMDFAPVTTVPGLLAGGVALNQATCAAGLTPSAFADRRQASIWATVTRVASGFQVTPHIDFRVEDTIDFCPGNCGGATAWTATIMLSRFEASGISGDVPFLVDYTISTPPFIV